MTSIRIKDIGPLIDTGIVEMKNVTLFIGAQSTGKSTLMKILCFCRWVEKRVMVSEERQTLYDYTHYNRFIRELSQFHRLDDTFFSESSEIEYHGDTLDIYLKGKKNAKIAKNADFKARRCNAKLCFIPSERNFISAIKNADRAYRSNKIDVLFNYVFEWAETHGLFTPEHPKVLSFDNSIEYYYDAKHEKDTLRLNKGVDKREIEPFYASSGVQSALPLEVIVDHVVGQIGKPVDVSQKWLMEFIRDYLLRQNSTDDFDIARMRENPLLGHILTYQYANLFIEEPEQNLFPKSQWDLLCHIVSKIKTAKPMGSAYTNALVLTTHSPYILSALNIMAKADKALQCDRQRTLDVMAEGTILPISSISAYRLEGGTAEHIINDETGMVDGNALDALSDEMEDLSSKLNDIIYG